MQLFVERARATSADLALDAETGQAVAEICRRVEGLPMAIELGLAFAAMFNGNAVRAAALAEESLTEARASGDQVILAQVLFFVSWVASNGAEPITARDLGALGTGLLNLGDLARVRVVLDEGLVVARRYEDRWSSAMSLMLLGHVDLAEGDVGRAGRGVVAVPVDREHGLFPVVPGGPGRPGRRAG